MEGGVKDRLEYIEETKNIIGNSINNIGGEITEDTPFSEYPNQLKSIIDNEGAHQDVLDRLVEKTISIIGVEPEPAPFNMAYYDKIAKYDSTLRDITDETYLGIKFKDLPAGSSLEAWYGTNNTVGLIYYGGVLTFTNSHSTSAQQRTRYITWDEYQRIQNGETITFENGQENVSLTALYKLVNNTGKNLVVNTETEIVDGQEIIHYIGSLKLLINMYLPNNYFRFLLSVGTTNIFQGEHWGTTGSSFSIVKYSNDYTIDGGKQTLNKQDLDEILNVFANHNKILTSINFSDLDPSIIID